MDLTRRGLMGALAMSSAVAAAQPARAAPQALDFAAMKKDADLACVYHCDFGDPQRFSQMLQNMLNHYSAYEFDGFRLKLVMVAHGSGVKFFLNDRSGTPWEKDAVDPELFKRFEGLAKYGAEVFLCRITFRNLNVDPDKARADPFIKMVPSGVATLAELQAKGFAYIKVG